MQVEVACMQTSEKVLEQCNHPGFRISNIHSRCLRSYPNAPLKLSLAVPHLRQLTCPSYTCTWRHCFSSSHIQYPF